MKEIDADDRFIHAVVCHGGCGLCVDDVPEHEMEKVLFASDELTGLIWAAAKMRPSKSTQDMEVKSLKQKIQGQELRCRLLPRRHQDGRGTAGMGASRFI